ncbi:unnamed protein product [Closterium sp. NIES-65]|nr:unnamed protein product [Closterium sp. NIES-65]
MPLSKRVDRLYGVGDGRTVVLAVDTCKGCISAFEDLLATGYKSTSFLGTHENPAARGEFRLSPADRLIVVFHRGHHLPSPLLLRRSRSDVAAQHQQLLTMLPPLTSPHLPPTAQPSPHQASPQKTTAAMFSFLTSPRTRSGTSSQQHQPHQKAQGQWPRSLSGSQQQQQQERQHQQQVQNLHAPNHWPRSRSEAGAGAAAGTAMADGNSPPPAVDHPAAAHSQQLATSTDSKADVETVVVVPSTPAKEPITDDRVIHHSAADEVNKAVAKMQSGGENKYAVIIDAGSTGSRIHVYQFNPNLELMEIGDDLELFVALKPGLSSFRENAKGAADSLRPLIDKALTVVPEEVRSTTPIRVGATAGLRLLPGDLADNILQAVREMLKEYPFTFAADSVKILDGADEGSFAWVTVNYLLGNLGKDISHTVGVVDLGGGSVQMTYAVPDDVAAKAPEGYVRRLSGMGKTYGVYVHSYLGFGLMAARAQVLKAKPPGSEGHACLPKGTDDKYVYGTEEVQAHALPTGGSAAECALIAAKALELGGALAGDPAPSCSFEECTFGGVWSGGRGQGASKLFIASYFFDRAGQGASKLFIASYFFDQAGQGCGRGGRGEGASKLFIASYFFDQVGQLGVIPDPKASSAPVKAKDFAAVAEAACATPLEEVTKKFPAVEGKDAPYMCLDVVYQHKLLTHGFRIDDAAELTLVKQVTYKGKDVEAAWPLGAAIDAISS